MPKNLYYDDVKIIKKPLNKRLNAIVKFFLIFLVFAFVSVISIYFSKALTVGNVGSLFVYGDKKIKFNECSFYAVTLGEYDNHEEASSVGLGANVQGASGYVWEEGKYYVVGNIYRSRQDAESVANNLKDTNYSIGIKEIVFPKINLDFEELENKQVAQIEEGVQFFDKVYDMLYDYSIKFDKSEINNLAISSGVSELRGECRTIISTIQGILKSPNTEIQLIQNSLLKLDELLNQTILKTIDNNGVNYSLKNSISSLVRIKYELFYSLV